MPGGTLVLLHRASGNIGVQRRKDSVFKEQGGADAKTGQGDCARLSPSYYWLDEADTFRALASSHQMRLGAYRQFLEQENGSPSDELIRAAINSNKLTGGDKFVDEIENRIGIRVETRKPGRPAAEK